MEKREEEPAAGEVVVRMLVIKSNGGQTHSYALARDGLVLVDQARVRRIEASTQDAQSFMLITDAGGIDITCESLCMLISGRLWTEPVQREREVSKFIHKYPSF